MAVVHFTEIRTSSSESFHAAIRAGLVRACKTSHRIRSTWIRDQELMLDEEGRIASYRVHLMVTFVHED